MLFKEELSSLVEKGSSKGKENTLIYSQGSWYSGEWLALRGFVKDRLIVLIDCTDSTESKTTIL